MTHKRCDVTGLEASQRARRIDRMVYLAVSQYEIRRMEEALIFVDEGAEFVRFGRAVESIDDGKRHAVLIDGFLGVFLCVNGERYDADSQLRKFVLLSLEFSQLLKTEGSPVAAIEKHGVPFVVEAGGDRQRAAADRRAFNFGELVSVVQLHSSAPFVDVHVSASNTLSESNILSYLTRSHKDRPAVISVSSVTLC